MRYPLSVKSKSVETSGIPRDYKEALCEYVNCTPFVRQYGILFRKWGVFVCQKDIGSTTERRR